MKMNRKYIIAIIVMLLMLPSIIFAECVNYEPDSVSLTGKIIRKTFPGRPNYENIKTGDEPETYWILILAKSLCVNAKPSVYYESETGINQVQIVFMDHNQYQKYKIWLGKMSLCVDSYFIC
ncbi:MAG: hypothetical protein WAU61_04145 [Smithella sp.]